MKNKHKNNFFEKHLSIVIPVYNEADSLQLLYSQLSKVLAGENINYELIFVDDGSTDKSHEILTRLSFEDKNVKLITFKYNKGKSSVYSIAFEVSCGRYIATIDADLQDSPSEIPKMLKLLNSDVDLAIGWKKKRLNNEPLKKIPSFFYNSLKYLLFGIRLHDSNCGLRVGKCDVFFNLEIYADRYRFIPELSAMSGFKVVETPVEHHKREYGRSKYGPSRFWTGVLDLLSVKCLSTFARKPLHIFGTLALIAFFFGGALEIYVLIQKFSGSLFSKHLAAMLTGIMLIIVGIQLFAIGLIGEIISYQNHITRKKIKDL